ncbi:hypothetical protein GCM10009663_57970 [Kitasatospora arboriphila]|uniref:Uncharacterized protein n=1 Tax=Kitasatospora arboriphila TaxID=258052 RepID=A0ABP4EM32_9ACTN
MLQAELVDPAGQTGVREAGLLDERGELRVLGAVVPGGCLHRAVVVFVGHLRRGPGLHYVRVERIERSERRAVGHRPLGHVSQHLSSAAPVPPVSGDAPCRESA